MLRPLIAALALACFSLPSFAQQSDLRPQVEVPIIERTKLFGSPSRIGARISPDGRWLSWIAPRDGVLNVWVAPADSPARSRPLTAEAKRPIRSAYWSPDSKTVLFTNDQGGDENFLLYGVDVATGVQKNYTPFEKTRVEIVGMSRRIKSRILLGINNRDPRWNDIYSLDLATSKLTLVHRNDGDTGYIADENLVLRLASRAREDGGADWYRMTGDQAEDHLFLNIDLDDSMTT